MGQAPNGLELREAALWASCPAARAPVDSFSRILAGQARSKFPHASRVRCSELFGGQPRVVSSDSLEGGAVLF